MAIITLVQPQKGQNVSINAAKGDNIALNFRPGDATLVKDGDNLVFSFGDDGTKIEITDFYKTYDKDNVPNFQIDNQEISGKDFFEALGAADLMPAAGPAAAAAAPAVANADGRYSDMGDISLLDGIDRLGGLDVAMNQGQETTDILNGLGTTDAGATGADNGLTLATVSSVNTETTGSASVEQIPADNSQNPTPPTPEPTPEPTTPVPNYVFMLDMGHNMTYQMEGQTGGIKFAVACSELLSNIQQALNNSPDAHINLGIVLFAAQAFAPGSNSAVWGLGENGRGSQWMNFTQADLPILQEQLHNLTDILLSSDAMKDHRQGLDWLATQTVHVDNDVVFKGKAAGHPQDTWSTGKYFQNNNYQAALDAASGWLEQQNASDKSWNHAVLIGGFMANFASNYKNGSFVAPTSFKIDFLAQDIQEKCENSTDNSYTDSLFTYTLDNKNTLHCTLNDGYNRGIAFDLNLVNGKYSGKSTAVDLSSLHIYDGKELSIGGHEYKAVLHMESGYLYPFENGLYVLPTDNATKIPLQYQQYGPGTDGDYNKYDLHEMWDHVGYAIEYLKTHGDVNFIGLEDTDQSHISGLESFRDFLIQNHYLDADEFTKTDSIQFVLTHDGDYVHANWFDATDGAESFNGTNNDDCIFGGTGNDIINGGDGKDAIYGGEGNDVLDGGSGDDLIYGGDGNDMLYGGTGHDTLHGGFGHDVLIGDAFSASTKTSLSDVTTHLDSLHAQLSAYDGKDNTAKADIQHAASALSSKLEDVEGSDDNTVTSNQTDDTLLGGYGNDILVGGSGNDILNGSFGNDVIFGGSGNDIIRYDSSDIFIDGGTGIDFLVGANSLAKDGSMQNIEVALNNTSGFSAKEGEVDINDLTSMDAISSSKTGITVNSNDGTLTLSKEWTQSGTEDNGHTVTYTNTDAALTLTASVNEVQEDTNMQVVLHVVSDGQA